MNFQAVGYLWAAGLAALAVVVLHLLARRRPKPVMLPTARFVPDQAVRAPAFHRRPSDLVLLLLRMAALLLLGGALARPQLPVPHMPVMHVTIGDSVGSLSAAFAAALRAALVPGAAADSIDLTIELPLTRDRWDAATAEWRAQWPGSVKLADVAASRRGTAQVVWPELPGGDSLRAVVIGDVVAVGAWGAGALPDGIPIAWFNDGRPAAVEVTTESGCVRHVAIGVPPDDSHLRPAFRRIATRLRSAPCGGVLADTTPLDPAQLALLRGTGGPAATTALPSSRIPVPPSLLLCVLAAGCLGTEQVLRRRKA